MRRFLVACGLAAVATAAVYSNHFRSSFHFDDAHAVEQNLFIRDLRNIPRFFTDARTFSALPSNQSYRPVVTTSLAVDYAIGGLDPVAFHADSFILFLLQGALLVVLFRRALSGNLWAALFGASLFALHAAVAETVNYVIARSEILSTLGAVATVEVWAHWPRLRRYGLYVVPAVLGVLAKEQGAMAAPLLFLWVGLVERDDSVAALLRPRALLSVLRATWPAFVACGAALALAMRMAPGWVAGGSSRIEYLLTQPFVMLRYAALFVVPVGLSADTDWRAVESVLDPRLAAGLAFVAAAVWLAVRASRTPATRPIAYGILWFFVALLPSSSVIPLAEVTNDHRMYFAFVGLALAAARAGQLAFARLAVPRLATVAACLLLAGHGVATHLRNEVWRSEATLWRDVTRKSPGNARGWMNYGLSQMAAGNMPEAERAYLRALELAPRYGYVHVNLAILQGVTGRPVEAEREFRIGLQLQPEVPSFRYFFARWLDQVGRQDEALAHLREALVLSPGEASARQLLLRILARRQDWQELARASRETLAIRPDEPVARELLTLAERHPPSPAEVIAASLRLWDLRRYDDMVSLCDAAIAQDPTLAEPWNNKCSALNMLARHAEAVKACERALELKPAFERARNNLALAREGLSGRR
jgi:tetratricopeptide (TPR) repeat protein